MTEQPIGGLWNQVYSADYPVVRTFHGHALAGGGRKTRARP